MVALGVKLVSGALGLAALMAAAWYYLGGKAFLAAGLILLLLAGFLAFFFRDPQRVVKADKRVIYAPADGKVVAIESIDDPPYLRAAAWRVAIFMNVFNVHVQRAPLAGKVEYLQYRPGEFKAAFDPAVGERNERNYIGLRQGSLRVLVVQVAGLIARRIICWCEFGRQLNQGERLGMIALGSRVDIYVPKKVRLKVQVGQKTRAGLTILGEL